jgi:hypothetical protein
LRTFRARSRPDWKLNRASIDERDILYGLQSRGTEDIVDDFDLSTGASIILWCRAHTSCCREKAACDDRPWDDLDPTTFSGSAKRRTHNIKAQAYPAMLIKTSLNDSQ